MVYVDANVFAFAVAIGELKSAETVQSQRVLRKIVRKELGASTSVLTWDEVVWACRKALPFKEALKKGSDILNFPNLKVSDATAEVVAVAAEVSEKYMIKPRDAIHAATAILSGEKDMISDDADFDRIKEIRRIPLAAAAK